MKTKLSLKAKITSVVLPLALGIVTLSAMQVWKARGRWVEARDLVGAGQYVQATSALIHAAQIERGKSMIFLSRKISRAELDERRKTTDAALEIAISVAARENVPFAQITEGFTAARRMVDTDGPPPETFTAYGSTILKLITSQASRTTRTHLDGLESRLLSLTLFERGKESLGRFRATLTATLAQDKSILPAEVSAMEAYRSSALDSFESPGLIISEDTKKAITDVLHSPQWNAVQASYSKVIHRATSGGYKEDSAVTFSNISWVIDEIYKLINAESTVVGKAVSDVETREKSTFWLVIVSCLLGTGLMSLLAWRVIQQLSASLASVTETLSSGASQVTCATRDISDMTSKLSTSTTEQAAALQETVTSIDEVSAMVSKNAENAKKSQEASVASTEGARKGKEAVSEMIVSIKEIAQANAAIVHQVETSNKELSEIVRIISEIGSKTKVINDIVFQTKLLSFNASVEAARAGEHGKGFAVVAEEVGNLAQMSGTAAKEISGMLDKSIQTVEQIVKDTKTNVERLVQAGKEKIDASTVTAHSCGEALDEMTHHVTEVNRMVTEIATASAEQALGVSEINKAMSQLDEVTQQNSSATQAAAASVEELTSQAGRFTGMVRTLKGVITGHDEDDAGGPASPSSIGNVLNFRRKKKPVPTEEVTPLKKAAGAENLPSSSDPRFEEF